MAAEVAAAPSMAVAPALTPTRPKEFMVDLSLEKSQPWSCSVARRSQKTRSHSWYQPLAQSSLLGSDSHVPWQKPWKTVDTSRRLKV